MLTSSIPVRILVVDTVHLPSYGDSSDSDIKRNHDQGMTGATQSLSRECCRYPSAIVCFPALQQSDRTHAFQWWRYYKSGQYKWRLSASWLREHASM